MAEEGGEPEAQIQPEDPQFQLQQHVKIRRKQQTLNATLKKLIVENVSEFRQVMDGTTYAFTNLKLRNLGISEITDIIENYPHLRKIDLGLNLLHEIPTLLNLKFITNLDLSRNRISNISFLSRQSVFPYLKSINLLGNKIEVLPIVTSKNLRTLNLNYNVITSLEEFDGHPVLEVIELRGNKLKNLKGLGNLPELRQLYAAENQLSDLTGIQKTPSLKKVHVRKNKISSLSEYPNIQSVKYLNLRENAVAKVDDLKGVSESVEIINLLGNPLEAELADNCKKEIWMKFRHFYRINKNEVTAEQKQQFDKEYKDRLAEQERERLEKEAAEKLAKQQQQQEQPEA